ncbi:MAG: hypothetical protein KGL46_08940 [Hyphomicrobiales bacterium]|nr:hypothetical protein [Hyphomicrobiales bacterium]
MRKFILAGAFAMGTAFAAFQPASAMPAAPVGVNNPAIQLAAYGCGRGWVPNRWGRCVPMRRWAPPPRAWRYDRYHRRHDWDRRHREERREHRRHR